MNNKFSRIVIPVTEVSTLIPNGLYDLHCLIYKICGGRRPVFSYKRLDTGGVEVLSYHSEEIAYEPPGVLIMTKPLPEFNTGDLLHFSLDASPSYQVSRGRRVAIKDEEGMETWLVRVMRGASIKSLTVDLPGPRIFRKGSSTITHHVASYSGTLEVVDAQVFNDLVASGVGPHKGFGSGMLKLR